MKIKPHILLLLSGALLAFTAQAQTFTGANLGTPSLTGSVVGSPPGVQTITGGGADIWGTADSGYYYYATISGQVWDAKVHVRSLVNDDATDDGWTKCELMIRIPASPGSGPAAADPFLAIMTTKTNGQNQIGPQWRTARGGNADWTAMGLTVRPTYPGTWLRMTRTGSLFTLYYGSDGTTWTKYADIDTAKTDVVGGDNNTTFGTPWPDPLLVGIAVTAHSDADATGAQAEISDLSITVTPSTPSLAFTANPQDATAYVGGDAYLGAVAATNTALANSPVGSFQWFKNGVAIPGATAPRFSLLAGAADNGAKIHCQASMAGATPVNSSTGTVTVLAATEYPGQLKYQAWSGLNRSRILAGDYAQANPTRARDSFEAPWDWSNNYGARLSGYFIPPVTGNYVFFVCSDDDSDLFISTNSSPANLRLVAHETAWSGRNNWVSTGDGNNTGQKRSDQFSPDGGVTYPWSGGIPLVAGQKYFIAGVMSEGGGGDNLSAYWMLLGDPDPVDGTPSNFTNGLVAALSWPATTLTITEQPKPITTFEGLPASLKVTASTDGEMTPLYQWQMHGTNLPGKTSATLAFNPATPANSGVYRCVITQPLSTLTVTSDEVTVLVQASVYISGIVRQEVWSGSSYSRTAVEDGTAGEPTRTGYLTMFDTPDFADNYVQRLSTWFKPATSGNYIFLLSSDDDSDLFLSTNDDPATKRMIAQQTGWNGNRNWSGASGQRSSASFIPAGGTEAPYAAGIPLVANNYYYIEAVHHEGTGGDNLAVYAMLTTDTTPADGTVSNLRGERVAIKLPKPTSLTITTQPQNATAHGWDQAIFSVDITTDALYPPSYQWRRGGVAIPNATGKTYSLVTSTNDNGAVFDCQVSLSQFGTSNSQPATLTVLNDAVFTPGLLKEEYFGGAALDDVRYGNVGAPTQPLATWTIFESRTNIADNFTRRVSGLFIPPTTGGYVFFTCSDDDSDFYISTDDQPKNKRLVAQLSGWAAARVWSGTGNRRSDTFSPDGGNTYPYSAGIQLTAGQRYYVESLHREGGGGDNLAVTYKLIDDPADPADGDAPLLTGSLIGYMAAPLPPARPEMKIALNPNGTITVSWTEGGTLQAAPSVTGPWQDVTGATSPYTFTPSASMLFGRIRK